MEVDIPVYFEGGERYSEDSIIGQDHDFLFPGKFLRISCEQAQWNRGMGSVPSETRNFLGSISHRWLDGGHTVHRLRVTFSLGTGIYLQKNCMV